VLTGRNSRKENERCGPWLAIMNRLMLNRLIRHKPSCTPGQWRPGLRFCRHARVYLPFLTGGCSSLLGHVLLQSFQSGEQLQSAEASVWFWATKRFRVPVFHETFVLEKQIVQNMQLSGGTTTFFRRWLLVLSASQPTNQCSRRTIF
jgi:hypothetical protein